MRDINFRGQRLCPVGPNMGLTKSRIKTIVQKMSNINYQLHRCVLLVLVVPP